MNEQAVWIAWRCLYCGSTDGNWDNPLCEKCRAIPPEARWLVASGGERVTPGKMGVEPEDLNLVITVLCQELGHRLPMREYRFAYPRRFRFDFAWPSLKIAVEREGGVFAKGTLSRHSTPAGYTNDCEKYSLAGIAGWCVVRVTPPMIAGGRAYELVRDALRSRGV